MKKALITVVLLCAVPAVCSGGGGIHAEQAATGRRIDLTEGFWKYYVMLGPVSYAPGLIPQKLKDPDKLFYSWHKSLDITGRTPPPPSEWYTPGFDDSRWPYRKYPLMVKPQWGNIKWQSCALGCFRKRFFIKNTAEVKNLSINVIYRGGVVIYINGTEIARRHLPEGTIGPDTSAKPYPDDCYILPSFKIDDNKLSKKLKLDKERTIPDIMGAFPGPKGGRQGESRLRHKSLPAVAKLLGIPLENLSIASTGRRERIFITRAEWQEIISRRNRETGPVRIPGKLLRNGMNVVAVEIHRSTINPCARTIRAWRHNRYVPWFHGCMLGADMCMDSPDTVQTESRAQEVRVWADDMHRRYFASDPVPCENTVTPIRMVGARNGTYSGQVVVRNPHGTVRLKGEAGSLSGPGGAEIPASCVTIRYAIPHPLTDLEATSGRIKGFGCHWRPIQLALRRYGRNSGEKEKLSRTQLFSRLVFFDHLTPKAPAGVQAGSCRPVWITVRIPKEAVPGLYSGYVTLTVGTKDFKIPVKLYVADWILPDPKDYETVTVVSQMPFGVAAHYKVPLWSDEHFRLMEGSFRLLSRLGVNYIHIPVVLLPGYNTAEKEAMMKWVIHADKTYTCDFNVFERYIDLARKYLSLKCVSFILCTSKFTWAPKWKTEWSKRRVGKWTVLAVNSRDKNKIQIDIPDPSTDKAREFWTPFIKGVLSRMEQRGLKDAIYWGRLFDGTGVWGHEFKVAYDLFQDLAPGVKWDQVCHHGQKPIRVTFQQAIRCWSSLFPGSKGWKGWRRTGNNMTRLLLPRQDGAPCPLMGASANFKWRIAPECSILCGGRGLGGIDADRWAKSGGLGYMTVSSVLWPGEESPEAGARFECLLEGIQETEARIMLERKLEGKGFADSGLGKKVQAVLENRIRAIILQAGDGYYGSPADMAEYYTGWQERSWDLYAAAAEAAGGRPPAADEKREFFNR